MKPEKIEAIYAWICIEKEGSESLAVVTNKGVTVPLIGSDINLLCEYQEKLLYLAFENEVSFDLVKFDKTESVALIGTQSHEN